MKIIRYLLTGACFLCFSFYAAEAASPDEKTKIKECFYYALPENYFTVTVTIEKINAYKGPLVEYANKVASLPYVIKKDSVYYSISGVKLEEHARIDQKHVYYVEISNSKAAYHNLYKDLLISNYNTNTSPLWQRKSSMNLENTLANTANRFNLYPSDDVVEIFDITYEDQIYDTVTVRVPKRTKTFAAKPTYQQAMEMIKTIESVRQSRALLINGEFETDFSKLELMLSELKKKEDDYLSLFGGIIEKEELSYTFTVTPAKKDSEIILSLFKFSKKYGINDRMNDMERISYTLRLTSKGIHEAVENADKKFAENQPQKKNKKDIDNNMYYRKPQYFMVSLYAGNELLHDFGIYPVSQFGETLPLPLNAISFELDSLTGGLKYINIAE